MTLEEIIQELHTLNARLRTYEQKYGIVSADFYKLYCQGFLGDEGFERSTEYMRWATAYKLKLKSEEVQRNLLKVHSFNFS
ncbi:MAG: hypothetical protein U0350_43055 [Caldilineaceae bacterium]